MKRTLILIAAILMTGVSALAQQTYKVASRDTCDLYLDIRPATEGSETTFQGRPKPLIIYAYGGAFVSGTRQSPKFSRWFNALNDAGYTVACIEYRLGMKGVRCSSEKEVEAKLTDAIQIAVDDAFAAVAWLCAHADELNLDPSNFVMAGCSAGAILALHADRAIANREKCTEVLPEGFRFAGIISFSGALLTSEAKVKYQTPPAPTLLIHGDGDNLVPYNQIEVNRKFFTGSNVLAKIFHREKYNYSIFRFPGHRHEVCGSVMLNLPEEFRFIEEKVMQGDTTVVDEVVMDSTMKLAWDVTLWDIFLK